MRCAKTLDQGKKKECFLPLQPSPFPPRTLRYGEAARIWLRPHAALRYPRLKLRRISLSIQNPVLDKSDRR